MIDISQIRLAGRLARPFLCVSLTCWPFASAHAADLCEKGTLQFKNLEVTTKDVDPEGVSTGDVRLVYGDLVSESGEKLGSLYAKREVLLGNALVTDIFYVFPEGNLIATSIEPVDVSRSPLASERIASQQLVAGVVGGTGRYKHTTGDVLFQLADTDVVSSAQYDVTFDIDCNDSN